MKYKILAAIIIIFVVIQFIPFGSTRNNPPITAEPEWDSQETRKLFFLACSDCHSHETKWPWYSRIAPVSWLVAHDVYEGREHFNISLWGVQKKNSGDEAAEAVDEGEMPPWFYLLLHPEANLTDTETADLIIGLKATFGEKKRGDRHD